MAGPEGLRWEKVEFSFAGGLDLKTHPHLIEAPRLLRALNVEFDELGALRLRKSFATIGLDVLGGGTIAGADVRKAYAYGDELLLFTKDALYSRSVALSKWARKDTHLAIAVSETTRFDNPQDQVFADRAQLGGVVVYVWVESRPGGSLRCFLAVADATTGATILAPVDFGSGPTRPRVIATDTRIIVLWMEGGGLKAKAIDPAAPAFTASGATSVSAKDGVYDAVRDPAADRVVAVCRNSVGLAYDIARVTAGLAVTASAKARACGGLITVAVSPTGQYAQVVRQDGVNILGDMIVVATLADNVTGQVIGTSATGVVNHLTAAYRSAQDAGEYRCYVYWSNDEGTSDGAATFELKSNWFGTSLGSGSEATFLLRQGLASRAFNHDGRVYVWTVFAQESYANTGTLASIRAPYQNTCFLYRDDGRLVSKSTWQRAGGLGYYAAVQVFGHLPGVALVSGSTTYAWCGVERGLVTTLQRVGRTYSARAPRDVLFTFDSDSARRVAQLGRTLYVSGGLVMQYDREWLTELGAQVFPWVLDLLATGAMGGAIPAGTYSYRSGYRWDNAQGEVDRSTTATEVKVTLAGADHVEAETGNLHVTLKQGDVRDVGVEMWRTRKDPPPGSPFYLVSSRDPAATTGANRYIENDPTQLGTGMGFDGDNLTDLELLTKEQHPENGAVLPRMAPPGATILAASADRLFVAGVPGELTRVWYSLLRNEGQVAGFNSLLSFELPAGAGPITAIIVWQETPIVFTATQAFAAVGDGFANVAGVGSNYAVRDLNAGVGALSAEVLAATPGGLVFLSRRGWYRLNGAWQAEYIGAAVEDYNGETWVGVQVVETQHQVRVLSTSRMLVWDWSVGERGEWAEWTQPFGRGLCMWRGTPMLVDLAVKQESAFAAVDYDMDVEMLIHLSGLQGFARVKWIYVLGEFKADHKQRLLVGWNYLTTYVDDRTKAFTGLIPGNPTQLQHGPSQPRGTVIRVRITIQDTNGNTPAFDAVTLTGLSLELGFKQGLNKRVAATQKQ